MSTCASGCFAVHQSFDLVQILGFSHPAERLHVSSLAVSCLHAISPVEHWRTLPFLWRVTLTGQCSGAYLLSVEWRWSWWCENCPFPLPLLQKALQPFYTYPVLHACVMAVFLDKSFPVAFMSADTSGLPIISKIVDFREEWNCLFVNNFFLFWKSESWA